MKTFSLHVIYLVDNNFVSYSGFSSNTFYATLRVPHGFHMESSHRSLDNLVNDVNNKDIDLVFFVDSTAKRNLPSGSWPLLFVYLNASSCGH